MKTQSLNTAQHTIILSAPPERVFAALTQPEQITNWWGDDSIYWMTNVQQDLRAGGVANYSGKFIEGREFGSSGVTRAADPPRMLEYTRKYSDGIPCAEETVIRYELEPCDGGTRLTVTHTGFETEEMSATHTVGWERAFAWLEAYLKSNA